MRIRRRYLNWGVFLICLGLVPLAVQLGWLGSGVAAEVARLWPLILIGAGLGLLLRFTRFEALGGVVVAATLGLLLGSVVSGGVSNTVACSAGQAGGPSVVRNGTAGADMRLDIELTCADIDVSRTPGNAWTVDVQAGNQAPTIEASDPLLRLRSADGGAVGPFGGNPRERWLVTLPTEPALSTSMTINAATARLHIGDGALGEVEATFNAADGLLDLTNHLGSSTPSLDATLNASSLDLILPSAPFSGSMTLNAASLEMCVPADVGLRITYSDTLSSHNFAAAGLTQTGNSWLSANYATAPARADLNMTANVSSTTLNPPGGCK